MFHPFIFFCYHDYMQRLLEIRQAQQNNKVKKYLRLTKKEWERFFGITINTLSIYFIDSRKEIDKIWGKKTERWLTAWASENNSIFILNPRVYVKESDHKNIDHFWKTLKHEYCHLYFKKLTHGANHPKWLNEGLACYFARQEKPKPSRHEALKLFNYFKKTDKDIYKISYFWVSLLIKKYGLRKLLRPIKSLDPNITQKKITVIFYRIYKLKYSKKQFEKLYQ